MAMSDCDHYVHVFDRGAATCQCGKAATTRKRTRVDPLRVTLAHLARAERWPIGTLVTVTKDDGSQVDTATRSGPWKLGDTWVMLVEGISGGYALARIAERAT